MKNQTFLVLTLISLVTFYLVLYITPVNIHGDGFRHSAWAEAIANTGNLIEHDPFRLEDIRGGERAPFLIPYPLTSHLMLALLYLFGGYSALKFIAVFMGIISSLFVFLIFRELGNKAIGFFSGIGIIVINAFIYFGKVLPSLEIFLVATVMMLLYVIVRYNKSHDGRYMILGGISLGLAIAIKQQALIVLFVLGIYLILLTSFDFIRSRAIHSWRLMYILLIALVMSFVPLYNQWERNGTIGHPEGDKISTMLVDTIPFLNPIFQHKSAYYEETYEIQKERILYRPWQQTPLDTIEKYMFFPITYAEYRYPTRELSFENQLSLLLIFSVFLIAGYSYLYKKNRRLLILILLLQFVGVSVGYFMTNMIHKYHAIELSLLVMVYTAGGFNLCFLFKRIRINRMIITLLATTLILILVFPYVTQYHDSFWMNSGRFDNNHLKAYKIVGDWTKENTPEDSILLTGSDYFSKYANRNTIWLIGKRTTPRIWEIISGSDIYHTLDELRKFDIEYVFVEDRLIGRHTNDGWPKQGLLELLNSEYFEKVKVVRIEGTDDEKFTIYKVSDQNEQIP